MALRPKRKPMDEQNDGLDILTQEQDVELDTTNGYEEEDTTDWKAKALKAEELYENQRIRAEKAEKLAKAVKSEPTTKQSPKSAGEISTQDLYALIDAKVPQEDINEVKEIANLKGITIAEALKSNIVKAILSDNAEMRRTAQASNVGTARRTTGKVSDDVLLSKASKGELPESDEDLQRLINARKGIK